MKGLAAEDSSRIATPVVVLRGPQRRHKRFRTQSLLLDNPVAGRVVNIGRGGLAIETLDGLAVGEQYHFKVRLGAKHLRLAGRVQWCRLTDAELSHEEMEVILAYHAGISLVDGVTSRAWREALRRITEQPYVIWHRARPRPDKEPLVERVAEEIIKPDFGPLRS